MASDIASMIDSLLDNAQNGVRRVQRSWATPENTYNLDIRSIFSREWLMVGHECQFIEAGLWRQFDIAGYPILILRDRAGNINAFHNVCRHRAYNVVDGDRGKASILSCRYHGWSYGLNGKLAKAPGYQELPQFQKEKNGLFSVHLRVDSNGFVWVNIDGKEEPEVAWNIESHGFDPALSPPSVDFKGLEHKQSLQNSSAASWRLLVNSEDVFPKKMEDGTRVIQSQIFPNSCVVTLAGFVLVRKVFPLGVKRTLVWYDVFRSKEATAEGSVLVESLLKLALARDKEIVSSRSKESSSISRSELGLNADLLGARAYEAVTQHYEREKAEGRMIWPAQKPSSINDQGSQEDILFCSKLGRMSGGRLETNDIEALY